MTEHGAGDAAGVAEILTLIHRFGAQCARSWSIDTDHADYAALDAAVTRLVADRDEAMRSWTALDGKITLDFSASWMQSIPRAQLDRLHALLVEIEDIIATPPQATL